MVMRKFKIRYVAHIIFRLNYTIPNHFKVIPYFLKSKSLILKISNSKNDTHSFWKTQRRKVLKEEKF